MYGYISGCNVLTGSRMDELNIATLTFLAFALALGGLTKGFAGSGLPTVSVATMAIVIDVPTAVALMPISLLVTNARQAFRGGYTRHAMRRFWPLLLCLPIGAVLGVKVLIGIDPRMVSGLVGTVIFVFALLGHIHFEWRMPPRLDRLLQPLVGFGAGMIGGISGIFAPPIVVHLMSLGLPKDEFVGTVGFAYLVGTLPMTLALIAFGRLGQTEALWGIAALVPVLAGMLLGERLRGHVSENLFRRALLLLLLLSGLNLIRQAFV